MNEVDRLEGYLAQTGRRGRWLRGGRGVPLTPAQRRRMAKKHGVVRRREELGQPLSGNPSPPVGRFGHPGRRRERAEAQQIAQAQRAAERLARRVAAVTKTKLGSPS